ncbi:hypothetical protein PENTCL1PPCAC_24430, partial [Pristionchus entomophagus]
DDAAKTLPTTRLLEHSTSMGSPVTSKRLSPRLDRLMSMPNRKMLTLLNTIRKKDSSTQEPLDEKTKRIVIGEWKGILVHYPELFVCAWQRSAGRSASIKKTFVNVDASDDEVKIGFSELSGVIQNFFNKIILVQQLDETQMRITCEALGARHIDFVSRGFNSAFWDVFLVCMGEVLSEVLLSYTTDAGRRAEIGMACERVFATTVHYMRTGYQDRRRREAKNGDKIHDHSPS